MKRQIVTVLLPAMLALSAPAFAQFRALPLAGRVELGKLVYDIAALPEPAVNQILEASTYWEQIPAAAKFADANQGLTGEALSNALAKAKLKLDPSVAALIHAPGVLDMMASNMVWTARLGEAVLNQREDVMAALARWSAAASSTASR